MQPHALEAAAFAYTCTCMLKLPHMLALHMTEGATAAMKYQDLLQLHITRIYSNNIQHNTYKRTAQ
jgi:hypothetical protein